jgi:hypothetical protein
MRHHNDNTTLQLNAQTNRRISLPYNTLELIRYHWHGECFFIIQKTTSPLVRKEIAMLKMKLLVAALGTFLFLTASAFADGPYHHSGGYNHGGYARMHCPPPPPPIHHYYRPPVVYARPYVVERPLYVRPAYPVYNYYYPASGGSFYLQGRNFSIGVGF